MSCCVRSPRAPAPAPAPAPASASPSAPLSTSARVSALFAAVSTDASLGWTQQSIREALQRADHSTAHTDAAASGHDHAQPTPSCVSPSAVSRSLPSTPFSPVVPRVLVTGRSTRRQRRVVAEPALTPCQPDETDTAGAGAGAAAAAAMTVQQDSGAADANAAVSRAESEDENASPSLPSWGAVDASQPLPSLPATPLSALSSPLRDATNTHSVTHRLSFSAAVNQPPPSLSKRSVEDHRGQLEQSFSRLSLAAAAAPVDSARDSLAEADLVIPESDCESAASAAHDSHKNDEDEDDEEVQLQPRNTKHKKKRIVISDSEEDEQTQDEDQVEADQTGLEQDSANEDEDESSPALSAPQASPVPAELPRTPDASSLSVPLDLESSEEEEEEEEDDFGRNKPKPAKKKRIVISDDDEEESDEKQEEDEALTTPTSDDDCEEDQHSAVEPDSELDDGVEGVPDVGVTGEYESDESDDESNSEDAASSDSSHSDSDAKSPQSVQNGQKASPREQPKAPAHLASAAPPAREYNVWNFDESSDDGLPSSAPTPVRRPLLTPKPKPSARTNPKRSTVKKPATKGRRRAIDSDEEKQYESDDLNFIASDDSEDDESESETSSSGSDTATNSEDDSEYNDDSDEDFETARSAKKSRKADAALPCISGRAFARQRVALLASTYAEFNRRIFSDRLPSDLCLKWSKTLLTTAGYCKWNRGGLTQIELSIKVCDNSTKMRETLAHEMCHAAVVAIDRLMNAPAHGSEFKAWGRKVTRTIPSLGKVGRCHSYIVHKPFKYQCQNEWCKQSYGRHSASVDVASARCSRCQGVLVFLGRFSADGTKAKERAVRGFALYVKEQYSVTKLKNPATPHRDIMKLLSVGWKSDKKQTGTQAPTIEEEPITDAAAVSQAQVELESQMAAISFD